MTRHATPRSDTNGSPIGSRLPRGIHSWSPEQVHRWIKTGDLPPITRAPIPKAIRIAVWHRDEGVCGICSEPADPLDWTCDHIVPAALEGPTVIDNLRVTHPRCNRTRPAPYAMTDEQIKEATAEWTANEIERVWMTFEEFQQDPAAAITALRDSGTVDADLLAALEKLVVSA